MSPIKFLKGFLRHTPRGREVTQLAYEHLRRKNLNKFLTFIIKHSIILITMSIKLYYNQFINLINFKEDGWLQSDSKPSISKEPKPTQTPLASWVQWISFTGTALGIFGGLASRVIHEIKFQEKTICKQAADVLGFRRPQPNKTIRI